MGLAVNFRSSKPITGKSKFIAENGQDLVRTSHVMTDKMRSHWLSTTATA